MAFLQRLRLLPLFLFALAAPLSVGLGNVAAGLLLATALVVLVARRGRGWPLGRGLTVALGLMLGSYALATALAGPHPVRWNAWLEESWLKLLLLSVPLAVGARPVALRRACETLLTVGALVAVYAIYQHFTGRDLWRDTITHRTGEYYDAVGFFGHHLSYAGSVLVLWMMATSRALHAPLRPRSLLFLLPVLLLGLALLWTHARSAQLGAAAGLIALAAGLQGRRRAGALGVLALAALIVVASPASRERFTRLAAHDAESTRMNLWRSSIEGIQARPLLGWGAGNFGAMLDEHEVEGFYDTRAHSHNDFLMQAVNAGLLGLAAALALLGISTAVLWRGRRRCAEEEAWIPLAGAATQVAFAVAGLFQVYQTDDECEMALYFLLGCGLALLQLRGGREPAES